MKKKYTIQEKVIHKIKKSFVPILAGARRSRLNNTDFTIISNNCWGGICYEYFGLEKQSPTVGTYLYAEDYIKLIQNLKYYLDKDIKIVNAKDSFRYNDLKEANHTDVPIGQLGDIEIVFLHYKNPLLAYDKWMRRVERVNWDNLIIKFSYMSKCNDECIKQFQRINGVKKLCFVPKRFPYGEDLIPVPSRINSEYDLGDDVFDWNRYIDIFRLINKPITGIKDLVIL